MPKTYDIEQCKVVQIKLSDAERDAIMMDRLTEHYDMFSTPSRKRSIYVEKD